MTALRDLPLDTIRRDPPFPIAGATTFHLLGDVHCGGISQWRLDQLLRDEACGRMPKIDAYLQLGDQTNDALSSQMDTFEAFSDQLTRAPMYLVPGNHDLYGVLTPEQWAARWGYGSANYSFDVAGKHIAVISGPSAPTASTWANITPAMLAWLDADLSANSTKPTAIASHFPPWDSVQGDPALEYMSRNAGFYLRTDANTSNSDDILDVIAQHPQVQFMPNGHTHSRITVPGLVIPMLAGSVRFASVNASCMWYCGRRAAGQSYGDAADPVHSSFASWFDDKIEVRYRHAGAGQYYGPNGERVLTVDGLGG